MNRRNHIILALAFALAGACSSKPNTAPANHPPAGSQQVKEGENMIDEAKAKDLALGEVKKRGKDPARYDITVNAGATEWQVDVVGKEPRAPGDELTVFVNKKSGELRVMIGE